MELEELKSTWQAVKPNLGETVKDENPLMRLRRRQDVKSRLLNRLLWGEVFSAVCLVMLATSRWWSPTKLPVIWIVLFCALILAEMIGGMLIFKSLRHINLWNDTNAVISSATVRIKKFYRNIELVVCLSVIPLFVWLSLIPPFDNLSDRLVIWALVAVAFAAELLWYRSNMRQLTRMSNWIEE